MSDKVRQSTSLAGQSALVTGASSGIGAEIAKTDIAWAAVWLASNDSDYVHCTSLLVDGGSTGSTKPSGRWPI